MATTNDKMLEEFIGIYIGLVLNSEEDGLNVPTTLKQDLLRHEDDGEWVPYMLSRQIINWTNTFKFPYYKELEMELEGTVQLVDNIMLAEHLSIVSNFVDEMSLYIISSSHDINNIDTSSISAVTKLFLNQIGPRILVALLGIRTTVGYIEDQLPPTKTILLDAFDAPHIPGSSNKLSVGARALSKHYHRGKEGWWGTLKGNDIAKNESAHLFCEKILSNAVWINLHQIAGSVKIVEYRVVEGYGARWAMMSEKGGSEVCVFRGFLEPQAVDGHECGWRH